MLKIATTRRSSDGRTRLSGPEDHYLGLQLSSPIVASAGPSLATRRGQGARRRWGGALVLPSLFEEEIVAEEVGLSFALEAGSEHFARRSTTFHRHELHQHGDRYLELLEETKKAVEVPVVASLNASSTGGWMRYAKLLAEAGADALRV